MNAQVLTETAGVQLEVWESSFKAAKQDLQEALQKVTTKAERTSFKHRVKQFLAEALNMAKEVEKALSLPAAPTLISKRTRRPAAATSRSTPPRSSPGRARKRRRPRRREGVGSQRKRRPGRERSSGRLRRPNRPPAKMRAQSTTMRFKTAWRT